MFADALVSSISFPCIIAIFEIGSAGKHQGINSGQRSFHNGIRLSSLVPAGSVAVIVSYPYGSLPNDLELSDVMLIPNASYRSGAVTVSQFRFGLASTYGSC